MSRYRPSSGTRLPKRVGIAVLILGATVVSLFPSDVKHGVEALLALMSGPDEATAQPAPEIVPDPSPAPPPAPPPQAPVHQAPPPPTRHAPAPRPIGPPRAMVVALGEAGVAPRLGSLLREALDTRGVSGVEGQENSIRLDEMVRDAAFDPKASAVLDMAKDEGVTVLVLIRGEPVARRDVSFYGRDDVATKWRVRVSAHDLRTGRGLGPGWGGELETTERGAVASLEHFLAPISDAVAPLVADSLSAARQRVATTGR